MNIVYQQWTKGGTGITNFSMNEFDLYNEAVFRYGNKDIVVSTIPMPPLKPGQGGSLHNVGKGGDMSAFWFVFKCVKEGAYFPNKQDDPVKAYNRAMGIVGKR